MVGFALLQLTLARKLPVPAIDVLCVRSFACPPGQVECPFPPQGKWEVQKPQEAVISLGTIVPPNSLSMCIEHCRGPETGGRVTVRHAWWLQFAYRQKLQERKALHFIGEVSWISLGRKAGGLHEKILRLSGNTNSGDLVQEILSECLLCATFRISFHVEIPAFSEITGEQINTSPQCNNL